MGSYRVHGTLEMQRNAFRLTLVRRVLSPPASSSPFGIDALFPPLVVARVPVTQDRKGR